jgi:hypothetical protein
MAPRNDDFDNYDQDGFFASLKQTIASAGPRLMIGGAVLALVVLGGIFWGAYPSSDDQSQPVPVVRADISPYKTAPDDPGGMEIAHRDSTVFSSIRDGEEAKPVENLLADETSEEPMPRSQLFAGLNTGAEDMAATAPASGEATDQTAAIPSAMPPQPKPTSQSDQAVSSTQTASQDQMSPDQAVQDIAPAAGATTDETPSVDMNKAASAASQLEPAAGAATAAPQVMKPGTHYVQVASIRDSAQATKEWKKLTAMYGSLTGMSYRTVAADLGAKGSFTRIQAGPMSKTEADKLCSAIKAKTPGGCMVVGK